MIELYLYIDEINLIGEQFVAETSCVFGHWQLRPTGLHLFTQLVVY
jgi:hypothetical protein